MGWGREVTDSAPYQPHSDTSREAAEEIAPRLSRLRQQVYEALKFCGPMTDEEICNLTGMRASTVRPRRVELVESAHVVDSGSRRKVQSGSRATLWRVTTTKERIEILRKREEQRALEVDRIGQLEELLSRWVNVSACSCLPELPNECLWCISQRTLRGRT